MYFTQGVAAILSHFLQVSCDLDNTVTGDMHRTSWNAMELGADRCSGERTERVSVVICSPICMAVVTEGLHVISFIIFNFHKNGHRKGRTFVTGTCDVYVSFF